MIRWTRIAAVAVYLAVALGALVVGHLTPSLTVARVFWTMLMPLVPAFVIVIGFQRWRAICPIASMGRVGASRWAKGMPRPPRVLVRWSMTISLGALALGLWLRLVVTNGDGTWMGLFLLAIPWAAVLVNGRWGGRAFCHTLCPVAAVERIYTDAVALAAPGDSRCLPCTGCVRACPDIDSERAYAATLGVRDRQVAFYAFPGLVFAFYSFFYLRGGDWAAFFNGEWADRPIDDELFFGAVAPALDAPAWLAAAVWLSLGMAASYPIFVLVERLLAVGWARGADHVRHVVLALSSFTALNLFYLFAGGPAIAQVPYGPRVVAFVVPTLAAVVLARRLSRGPIARPTRDTQATEVQPRRLPVLSTSLAQGKLRCSG